MTREGEVAAGVLRRRFAEIIFACHHIVDKVTVVEVVPWVTPKIAAVMTLKRMSIPCSVTRVDGMVVPSVAVKILASARDGMVPPPTTRACLTAWAASNFQKSMVCCLIMNGCTPTVKSFWSSMQS